MAAGGNLDLYDDRNAQYILALGQIVIFGYPVFGRIVLFFTEKKNLEKN